MSNGVFRIFEWQLTHPLLVFLCISLLCLILNAVAFCINSPNLDTNPDQAFQTWRTNISGIFKTWEVIENQLTFSPPEEKALRSERDKPRLAMAGGPRLFMNPGRARSQPQPQTALVADRIVNFAKCLEKDNNLINALRLLNSDKSQIPGYVLVTIFEAPNYDEFFSKDAMQDLCQLEERLSAAVASTNSIIDLVAESVQSIREKEEKPVVFVSFFDFIKCLSIPTGGGCEDISNETLTTVSTVYRDKHECIETACRIPWETKRKENFCNATLCGETFCSGLELASTLEQELLKKFLHQSKQRICSAESILLSERAWEKPGPVYGGLFIYFAQNQTDVISRGFDAIWNHRKSMKKLKLVGIMPNYEIITGIFGGLLRTDLGQLASITLLILFLVMWIYTKTVFYTVASIITLGFSFGLTYFLYVYIFRFDYWFTNYLAAIILLGIGADDCFVLKHLMKSVYLPAKSQEGTYVVDMESVKSLRHAALAMLVTSATTAIAFACNLMSNVVAIKSFGIFSATLVLICYGMVVIWLPVCIALEEKYIPYCFQKANFGTKIVDALKEPFVAFFERVLPALTDKLKYLFVAFTFVSFSASCIIIFAKPKLAMGQGRPQLFHSNHPIQWFWDQYSKTFTLEDTKTEEVLHVVWGISPDDPSSPIHRKSHFGSLNYYASFEMNEDFLAKQEDFCKIMNRKSKYTMSYCFAHEYFSWIEPLEQQFVCDQASDRLLCRLKFVMEKLKSYGPFVLTHDTIRKENFDKNGPLFEVDEPHGIRAYVQTLKRSFISPYMDCPTVSTHYEQVEKEIVSAMDKAGLNSTQGFMGFVVPSSSTASRYLFMCDLQKELSTNTVPSLLLSLGIALIVIAMVTRNLKLGLASVLVICSIILAAIAALVLAEWKLNIVESIIIIMCVGLSFDFTLHYAVGYKITHKTCVNVREQIDSMFKEAAVPVFLSAFSTFAAGLVFTFAEAYPFYQIGVFMVVITSASWIGATFLFTSCVAVLDTVINSMKVEKYDVS